MKKLAALACAAFTMLAVNVFPCEDYTATCPTESGEFNHTPCIDGKMTYQVGRSTLHFTARRDEKGNCMWDVEVVECGGPSQTLEVDC